MASTLHRKRVIAHGANAAAFALAGIGILVVGYILVERFRPFRKDFTQAGLYTLAPRTTEILAKLDKDVEVTYFALPQSAAENAGAINQNVEDLLAEFQTRSKGHLKYTMANPLADAELLQELGGDLGAAVLKSGDRKIVVQGKEIMKEDYDPEGGGEGKFTGEEAFDSGLLRLEEGKSRTACFVTGHGEPSISGDGESGYSYAKEFLRRENFESKEVNLSEASGAAGGTLGKSVSLDKPAEAAPAVTVPADCTVLVEAGPQEPIEAAEADAMVAFWEHGGGVLLLAEPMTKSGVEALAARFGVTLLPGVVADPARKLRSPLAILPIFMGHEIVNPLAQEQTKVLFVKSIGMKVAEHIPEGETQTPLLQTSPSGIDLVDIKNGEADPDSKKNIKGPIVLGIAVEKKLAETDKTTRVVVLGDSDFAGNAAIQAMASAGAPGDIDLFQNAVSWTAGAREKIGIGPKSSEHHPVTIADRDAYLIGLLTVLGMPGVVFASGIGVWARRRRK